MEFFSKEEFISVIEKCDNSLALGLDKLFWKYLKIIIKDITCLNKFINIVNACIKLGHWSLHFKISITIVISKSKKKSYDSLKAYQLIILLNIIGKLVEKVIGERM